MKTGTRILVVDDEESLRTILSEVLQDDGHEVVTAESGEQAIELYKQDYFPLVITDIRMPGMNGIDLLKKIKALDSSTQVIIITSHASLDTSLTALREGAYDYLIKPFEDLNIISVVVNRALEKIRLVVENSILVEKLKNHNEELERINFILRELAIRDNLTGLYNHRYFHELISLETARGTRHSRTFSLIFIDVDNFKKFNDANGHPAGDALLRNLAQIFRTRLRQTDIAARYGGEEFVLLLPETPKGSAIDVAEVIRKQVESYVFEGRESQPDGKVTISMGVANFPDDGHEPALVLNRADQAMYKAKSSGRNRVLSA